MSVKIGFVILSHADPGQLLRLVRTLQRLYDDPPIVCHHDFTQSALSTEGFPSNVRFVQPHVRTRWGQFSVVLAALRALEILYEESAPDWFYLISAADYPTASADHVVQDIDASEADAFLDFREASRVPSVAVESPPKNPALRHFVSPGNIEIAWRRYIGLNLWFPILRSGPRIGRHTLYTPFKSRRTPFGPTFKCFYGDHWFSGNQKAAEILLGPTAKHLELRRHLRWRASADECYYQSVLANAGLKIEKATRRFSEWNGGGAHPKILGTEDLPAIISSKAHFARKFEAGTPVLDEIDRFLFGRTFSRAV
jgi:hypothetical protein